MFDGVEVLERGVYADGQHLYVIVAEASRDEAREIAETYGRVLEADEADDGRISHEVVAAPSCTCQGFAGVDAPHAPGCPINRHRIAREAEAGS